MTSVGAADNQLICRCKDAGQQRVLKFHLLVAQSWFFFPPFTTGLVLHSQVGEADVHRGSCGKEDLDKPTNSSLHFAMQEWVTPQSPALCHPLCLPRPADAKVQCRALRRSWGDIFLLYLQGNIGREGGLDAYLAALVHSVSLASRRNDKMIKNGIMSKRKIFKINCRHQRWLFLHINVGVFCFFFFRFFFSFSKGIVQSTSVCFYFHKHFEISCQTSPDNNLGVYTPNFLSSSFKEQLPFRCSPQTHTYPCRAFQD